MSSSMELSTGDLVWFDPGVGHWLPGEVLECHKSANVLTVQALINGKPQTFALSEGEGSVRSRQDLGNGVEDLTQLGDLHEAALLWNLKLRYDRGLIYTGAGSGILVAVNPYRTLDPGLYDKQAARQYRGSTAGTLPPHLFAVGAAAYAALPAPQAVVVSGESGSGKTESTKLVVQYLAAVSPAASGGRGLVTEQILEAAPLLEAFGNARTCRNDNSSRFGKYLEIYFDNRGSIAGARLREYLLEKSRIVSQAPGERNYHVFYELLGGLGKQERQKYGLVEADKYFYLNQGGGDCAPGHSGSAGADWSAITRALQVMGLGDGEQTGIVKVLASVLHLGNVYFHRRQLRHGQEGVEIGSDVEIKWAAHLLQISSSGMQRALTTRVTDARGERVHSPLTIDQALDARDAFAKALYSALFTWLVSRINSTVQRGGLHEASRICLLDIFGFENFQENSFEQLCINYASETLQLYFNKHVFKIEQQEYAKERLEWSPMTWLDNTPVIHLLGKKPVGILHLLDDESNFPKGTDHSFLEKCHYNHALDENYCRPRVGAKEFGIRHFAGQVWYSVDCFLDKNRDILRTEVVELLASSKEPLIGAIARPLLHGHQAGSGHGRGINEQGRFVTMKPRTPTVAARFSDSLHQLMEMISKCQPHFVRCVKPNNEKQPQRFDMPVVLEQLRYLGMLDVIRIRQCGYPIRMIFKDFVDRYRYILTSYIPKGAPYRDLCRAILKQLPSSKFDGAAYQLGATRVFLRDSVQKELEAARNNSVRDAAVTIQRHVRGWIARRRFATAKTAAVILQSRWKGRRQRRRYIALKRGVVKMQALARGNKERKRFAQRKLEHQRRVEAEKFARERAAQRAAKEAAQAKAASSQPRSVHHLEIPAELAFIFSKLEGYQPVHSERHLVKVTGGVSGALPVTPPLPHDLHQYEFGKFSSVYFKNAEFGVRREPITAPFLSKAAARDQDFQDAVALFKLVLRWSGDAQLTGSREKALADYISYKGLNSRGLRDELLVQLCNQTWKNDNSERVWLLMSYCLSCFQPSPPLSKYLLKFIEDHASASQKEALKAKLLRGLKKAPHSRNMPPTLLEWRSGRQRSNMALTLTMPDNAPSSVYVDSWTTCEEAAAVAVSSLEIPPEGWSVVMETSDGVVTDCNGLDYVLDLVSELELWPAFPIGKTQLLKATSSKRHSLVEADYHQAIPSPTRPQVPPPEPPKHLPRKASREAGSPRSPPTPVQPPVPPVLPSSSRKQSHDDHTPDYSHRKQSRDDHTPDYSHHRKQSRDDHTPEYSHRKQSRDDHTPDYSHHRKQSRDDHTPEYSHHRKQSRDDHTPDYSHSKSSRDDRYSPRDSPPATSTPAARKTSHEALSRSSALNERYFDIEKVRSRSLDNLLSEPEPGGSLVDLGLSQSRLNDRYHSVEQLSAPIKPVLSGHHQSYLSKEDLAELEYPDHSSSISTSQRGGPRYIKSHYTGKKAPPGSHSSRAQIERSEIGVRSSAMSDTSEAPSLASHVRRVRVPSQASDVDQFLDELFSPVLDGNLDELSDARSLAASIKGSLYDFSLPDLEDIDMSRVDVLVPKIKGGGRRARSESQGSSLLDQEVESLTNRLPPSPVVPPPPPPAPAPALAPPANGNMDQYISDLFQPIFINESLKTLTENHNLVETIKGGGTTGPSTTGYHHQSTGYHHPTSSRIVPPLVESGAVGYGGFPPLQPPASNPDMAAYQRDLQRAFLQSAMAQNIQIQQQLLAQNQALQQLLTQQVNGGESKITPDTPTKTQPGNRKPSFTRKVSRASSGAPPPPPPPMPPPLECADPSETRPFMDPYGRAKTVRIGKWRWPPAKEDLQGGGAMNGSDSTHDDFMQFKMRQKERKITPQQLNSLSTTGATTGTTNGHFVEGGISGDQTSAEWEEIEFDPVIRESERHHHNHRTAGVTSKKAAYEIGAARPSPGSVGKLKLSSEMRQRLEKVTANHSVRSTSSSVDKPQRTVNKLEDTRKMMLEQQLSGRWADDSNDRKSGSESPPTHVNGSWSATPVAWKPGGPPPPPIGPASLPPAPPGPAPPPPSAIKQPPPPVTPLRETPTSLHQPMKELSSFMAQRQERDTFGVHQNRTGAGPGSGGAGSKRNSFSANWETQSSLTQGTIDDGNNWAKDEQDGRRSASWEVQDEDNRMASIWRNTERDGYAERRPRSASKEPESRPTFRTHQLNKSALEREKKHSIASTERSDKSGSQWPEFMRVVRTPPPKELPTITPPPASGPTTCHAYGGGAVRWKLRVRKEVFTPAETVHHKALHLVYCQVAADVLGMTATVRLSPAERRAGANLLSSHGVTSDWQRDVRTSSKKALIELARTWPLYFSRLWPVSGAANLADVQVVAVSHWGLHLARREPGSLVVLKSFPLQDIGACTAPRPTTVSIEGPQGRISLHTPKAQQLSDMVTRFCSEYRKIQYKQSPPLTPPERAPIETAARSPPVPQHQHQHQHHSQINGREASRSPPRRDEGARSPSSPPPPQGKHSLMQFALKHFRQAEELEGLVRSSEKNAPSKDKHRNQSDKDWTWRQATDLIKWQGGPIEAPLLKLEEPQLAPLAVECFECILRYCGDLPLTQDASEVKCVYTILMHCHKHPPLRDEVYCQLLKQTTSNKSPNPESCQRAWRLLSILAAYFTCSDRLLPVLIDHLQGAASDRRRVCHGTAQVCLANLRKTQRCGGRKNVPSVEEVTAVSAGRSARRQIYRLPGGAERVVNTRCSTVVQDVIQELCGLIGVNSEAEQQEFSLYCIVQGDAFTMPLAGDEYILDVTTELHKAAQPFYLIFCRSVWYHPLRHDASPLYTEVLFNQVAPDYLEGLLLRLGSPALSPGLVRDMALVAALLHRAADLAHQPTLKEVKFLLPKPVLALREPRPAQWLGLVHTAWGQAQATTPPRAKHRVLQVLSGWPLFGSSFFAVKKFPTVDGGDWQEHILALNRSGVHFLDMDSHDTVQHWPYAEVISTRKVRSEDGALYLDMKCGNLLQQRVVRLQTEQAHEISRLVRQYIGLEQANSHN